MGELEPIIMDLMGRLIRAEQKIDFLESKVVLLESKYIKSCEQDDTHDDDGSLKITRAEARRFVIKKITSTNPRVDVSIGKRTSRVDLVLNVYDKNKNLDHVVNVKYYYSRSYAEYPSGWNTVDENDILNESIALYIFTIFHKGNYHNFIFTKDEIIKFIKGKNKNDKDLYYFYFRVLSDDKMIENRDEEKEAKLYYEKWEKMQNI